VPPHGIFPSLSSLNPQNILTTYTMSSPLMVVASPLLLRCHLHSFSLDMPPLPCDAPSPVVHFSSWFPLVCRLVVMLHYVAPPPPPVPYVAPPPHVSILYPLPSFALAGCHVASCSATSASHPLVNTAASRRAGNSTSRLPLVRPNWLPHCLMWHLRLTPASSPSPLPPHLVASRSHLPWLVVVFCCHCVNTAIISSVAAFS
jgi:hypothetical protein